MNLDPIITTILTNFNLCLYLIAIVVILIDRSRESKLSNAEIVFRWMALIYLGGTYIFAAITHLQLGHFAGALKGDAAHSMHFEVAGLELILALVFIGAYNSKYGWRLAVALFSALIAWVDVGDHMYNMWQLYAYIPLNLAQVLDVSVPFILFCCLPKLQVK